MAPDAGLDLRDTASGTLLNRLCGFQTRRREDSVGFVPKIDTRTVAEHRNLHHARLLGAALDYVAVHDVDSLTLAELAKRTGRSRASLYAYFGSAEDLRATVCAETLELWVTELVQEIRQVSSPGERLDRFVTAQIDRPHDPTVDAVLAYVGVQHSEPFRTRVLSTTEPLTAELLSIIEQLGVDPPTRAATIVQGAVAAAYDQVRAGGAPVSVADDAVAFVRAGLAALRHATPTDPTGRPTDTIDTAARADIAGTTPGASPRPPGALAATMAPSMPAMFASAMPAVPVQPLLPTSRRRSFGPVARFTAASMALTAVGFVSGITGVGGSALHLLLGVSLIGLLAWAVRAVAPARLASQGLRTLLALAVVTSAVALVAGPLDLDTAVAAHIALAALLLVGSATATAAAVRTSRTMTVASHPM